MYLFFDTETTGFANFGKPCTDPVQPHLVQLGAILLNEDRAELDQINTLVKPDGWTVPEQAANVHGFTTEQCEKEGRPRAEVLNRFLEMAEAAEYLVAHNADFDHMVISAALHRANLPAHVMNKKLVCTMKPATNICKLPGKYRGKYKWPKLEEAYEFFFGEKFEGAHDAMADVRACAGVFFKLLERNAINLNAKPKVQAEKDPF